MNNKDLYLFLDKNDKLLTDINIYLESNNFMLVSHSSDVVFKIIKNIKIKENVYLDVICEYLKENNIRRTKNNIDKLVEKISDSIDNLNAKDRCKISKEFEVYLKDIPIKVLEVVKNTVYKNMYIYNFEDEAYVEIKKTPNLEIYNLSKNKRLISKTDFNKIYFKNTLEKIKEESCCLIVIWLVKMKKRFEDRGVNIEDTISNIGDVNEIDELVYKCIELILSSKYILGAEFIKILLKQKKIKLGD